MSYYTLSIHRKNGDLDVLPKLVLALVNARCVPLEDVKVGESYYLIEKRPPEYLILKKVEILEKEYNGITTKVARYKEDFPYFYVNSQYKVGWWLIR